MRLSTLAIALLLIGAGCAAPPMPELPSEPPTANPGAPTVNAPPVVPPAANTNRAASAGNTNAAAAPTPIVNAPSPAPAAPAPFYITYSAAQYQKALADKRPVVLYFWASWCPICRADEPIIKQRIESSGLPIAGFRVDFDAQADLKQQFRIPYQHTTVMLDASGNESTRFTGPVDGATFTAALRTAAGAN